MVGWMISPVWSERNKWCWRKNSDALSVGFKYSRSPVALWYSTRPQRVDRDSLTDEWSASGLLSQFHPPSGHCHSTSDSASFTTRGSSARPSRLDTANALPSWEAHLLYRPLIFGILLRWASLSNHFRTRSVALTAGRNPGAIPSSTRETRRQCAPVHFW